MEGTVIDREQVECHQEDMEVEKPYKADKKKRISVLQVRSELLDLKDAVSRVLYDLRGLQEKVNKLEANNK